MICPECHKDSGYHVCKEPYDKTPERTVKMVSCDSCGEKYPLEMRVWKGDGVVD
jgi:hypothetical protein